MNGLAAIAGNSVGAEDLLAVVGAGEQIDDVARDRVAGVRMAVAGLHHVRDQCLDLDDLAALGLGGNVDEGARHHGKLLDTGGERDDHVGAVRPERCRRSSRRSRPPSACRRAGCAWRSARGRRAARGCTLITFGCGFFSLKTWIALTWSAAVIGLSTVTVSGTVLPFSTSGGMSSFTLPVVDRRFADDLADRRLHGGGRGAGGPHGGDRQHREAGGASGRAQHVAPAQAAVRFSHHGLHCIVPNLIYSRRGRTPAPARRPLNRATSSGTRPHPRSAPPSASACRGRPAPPASVRRSVVGRHDGVRIEPRAHRRCAAATPRPTNACRRPSRSGARVALEPLLRERARSGRAGTARSAGCRRSRGRAPGRPSVPVSERGIASPTTV